jgi:hypothetical protein
MLIQEGEGTIIERTWDIALSQTNLAIAHLDEHIVECMKTIIIISTLKFLL